MNTENQATMIGVRSPPNLARIPPQILQAASPPGLSLAAITRVNQQVSEQSKLACNTYKGVQGLQQLQKDQGIVSELDAGCGWIYDTAGGLTPRVNQGALGTNKGPIKDTLSGNSRYYWDLEEAEKDISKNTCASIQQCSHLKRLGQVADLCGYCKSSGRMIPVKRDPMSGRTVASYEKDPNLGCPTPDIVTRSTGVCPPEGFMDYNKLFECTPPLSKNCVQMAAQFAGCSPNGTLLAALSPSTPYDSKLKTTLGYQLYSKAANPNITPAILRDGSASIDMAIQDFQQLQANTQSSDRRLKAAAKDLCHQRGFVEPFENPLPTEVYNFCNDMRDTDVITSSTQETCMQKYWYEFGGTQVGARFPRLAAYQGKTWAYFKSQVANTLALANSQVKSQNIEGLRQLRGDNTQSLTIIPQKVPVNRQFTNGAETLYFIYRENEALPILIRASLDLVSENRPVVPTWNTYTELANRVGVNGESIATVTVLQLITEKPFKYKLSVTGQSGVIISENRMPFEGIEQNRNPSTWSLHPGRTFTTPDVSVDPSRKTMMTIQTYSTPQFARFTPTMTIKQGTTTQTQPLNSTQNQLNFFLTQEPLAPWLQFEVANRLNKGRAETTLVEKRFVGQIGISQVSRQAIPMLDVETRNLVIQTRDLNSGAPNRMAFARFSPSSIWHTKGMVGYSTMRTLTMLVRPRGRLPNQGSAHIFQHSNKIYRMGCFLKNTGGDTYEIGFSDGFTPTTQSQRIQLHKWHLIVIQYLGNPGTLSGYSFHVAPLDVLQNSRNREILLQTMRTAQNRGVQVRFREDAAGHLILGAADIRSYTPFQAYPNLFVAQSFEGDVAWVHGFRQYINSDEHLVKELQQKYMSDWPRGTGL